MWLRYGTGSTPTIKSGSTDYNWARNESNSGSGTVIISNSNGDSRIVIASHVEDVTSDPETSMSGNFYLYNPSSGTLKTFVNFTLSYSNNTTSYSYDSNSSGRSTFTTAVTSLQFLLSGSTFTSGTVKVYGIV